VIQWRVLINGYEVGQVSTEIDNENTAYRAACEKFRKQILEKWAPIVTVEKISVGLRDQ
jgi:hypothetical protein